VTNRGRSPAHFARDSGGSREVISPKKFKKAATESHD
jgi:hypothetical protein